MTAAGQPVGNKNSGQPYQIHLDSRVDLVTSHIETRAGFLELALEKNRQATPFITQARALKAAISSLTNPAELLTFGNIQSALVTAAGLSDKAAGHLDIVAKEQAVRDFIANFLDPAGTDWIDELVYRFLITRGDTVGGSMRNIGGAIAQRKLTRNIIAALSLANISFEWRHAKTKKWLAGSFGDPDIEVQTNALSWANAQGSLQLHPCNRA
jgi:hypothetical protein